MRVLGFSSGLGFGGLRGLGYSVSVLRRTRMPNTKARTPHLESHKTGSWCSGRVSSSGRPHHRIRFKSVVPTATMIALLLLLLLGRV